MTEKEWYPRKLRVGADGTAGTYEFLQSAYTPDTPFTYAEFGIYQAATARHVCELFPAATLYLFDFQKNIDQARKTLSGFPNEIKYFANSERFNDSYNWSLGKLVEQHPTDPIFDYCFLDGAHTFAVDALNYYLCDRLLKVGGYMDFDDYHWKLRGSSLDPLKVPEILLQYTEEQIDARQVKMIVDVLVRPDPRYQECVKNKVFRKIGGAGA